MNYDSILRPRITVSHLALAKGWVNGLDLADLGKRYFPAIGIDGGAMDLRETKSTLLAVMRELALASARVGIPGGMALVRSASQIKLNPKRSEAALPCPAAAGGCRPSYEEYVASLADADAFSDSELLQAYEDRHPQTEQTPEDKAVMRRSRLVTRQLDLIERLQNVVTAPIRWDDAVDGWFAESLAERLQEAGVDTIFSLAKAIMVNPDGWFKSVNGVGVTKAERILGFLQSQGLNLNEKFTHILSERELANRPTPLSELIVSGSDQTPLLGVGAGTQLAPSPALTPSSILPGALTLDGSEGRFRHHLGPPIIDAQNDLEAMQAWLKNKTSPATVRLYEREILRLIAWSVGVCGKPMSSLMYEDALAYRDFLGNIPPNLQSKKGPRARPSTPGAVQVPGFSQARLSPASINKTLVIISGFFTWMQAMRYISANPFFNVRARDEAPEIGRGSTDAADLTGVYALANQIPAVQGRSLPQEAIEAIDIYLDSPALPGREAAHARERFIFYFAYLTGLRISEIAEARRGALGYLQPNHLTAEPGGWYLDVFGKGNKYRRVSVPDQAISELERYLMSRGLLAQPSASLDVPPGTFLVGGLVTREDGSTQTNETPCADGRLLITRLSKKIKAKADGVRPQTIHLALKGLFNQVLTNSQFKDRATVEKVRKASTHWLRHTSATHALAIGVPVEVVSSNLGHASLDTTSRYIDTETRRNLKATREAWGKALAEKMARLTQV